MKAMLLAAGEGTRFRPHTTIKPKPALTLLNVPLGFYSFDHLKEAGVNSLVVNTYHLPNEIKTLYKSQNWFPVQFTEEKDRILGSGGGLWNAKLHFLDEEDFFLLNADEVVATQNSRLFSDLKRHHQEESALATLLVMENPEVGKKFGGVWVNAKGKVIGFGKEKPADAVHGYHFMGVQVLHKEIFRFLPEGVESNILYDGLMEAIRNNRRVQIHKVECEWFETGNLNDYLLATRTILQNFAAKNPLYNSMQELLGHLAPTSQLIKNDDALVWADSSSRIVNVNFKDFAVVGKNAKLSNCEIEASVIAEAHVLENQKIYKQFIL